MRPLTKKARGSTQGVDVPKTIVITGAGVGLGRALARRFASDGDRVVLLGRTLSKLQAVVSELGTQATALECDVSSPDSVKRAFHSIASLHSKIDALINNAAVYEPFLLLQASDEQLLRSLNTNLLGPILCTRAALPLLGRGGHIINVSSESVGMHFPHLVMYQTSKAGLERFSESMSRELEASGIRVTTVRAGQMMEADKSWDIDPEAMGNFIQAAMAAGLNLLERPVSQFGSIPSIFRALIDLPEDLHVGYMALHARKP
jgi:meso-butanediol dehydrogenase / (S,S)-butanediol dehydrogenase / diacetyl reductase